MSGESQACCRNERCVAGLIGTLDLCRRLPTFHWKCGTSLRGGSIIRRVPVNDYIQKAVNRLKLTDSFYRYRLMTQRRRYREWLRGGKPLPPPHIVKQETVRAYAHVFDIAVLVETGTYLGEMIEAMREGFDEIYSIELGFDLARNAQRRFALHKNITILQGNSADILRHLLPQITRPAVFWLDAHYSGGTTADDGPGSPLETELSLVLSHPLHQRHVVLVDDARYLGHEPGYPPLRRIREIASAAGLRICEVRNDILRIHDAPPG